MALGLTKNSPSRLNLAFYLGPDWRFMRILETELPYVYDLLIYISKDIPRRATHELTNTLKFTFHKLWATIRLARTPLHRYKKLPDQSPTIRLLRLAPKNNLKVLQADFVLMPISNIVPFETVSWRWSTGCELPMLLDGQKFLVTERVHAILRSLQSAAEHKLVWIDAVCINQLDSSEKTTQVPLMRCVYQNAERVIGYLEYHPLASRAVSTLAALSSQLSQTDIYDVETLRQIATILWESYMQGSHHGRCRAAIRLLANHWFSRVWIIQEVALAKKLVLRHGTEEMCWSSDIANAMSVLTSVSSTFSLGSISLPVATVLKAMAFSLHIQPMDRFSQITRDSPDGIPLKTILQGTLTFESTLPRDRVYAVLGLATEEARKHIVVDYKNISDAEVFCQASKFVISQEKSFEIMNLAGIRLFDYSEIKVPSWVPPPNIGHIPTAYMHLPIWKVSSFRCGVHLPMDMKSGEAFDVLKMDGAIIDLVAQMGPIIRDTPIRLGSAPPAGDFVQISQFFQNFFESCDLARNISSRIYAGSEYNIQDSDYNMMLHMLWKFNKDDDESTVITLEETRQRIQQKLERIMEMVQRKEKVVICRCSQGTSWRTPMPRL